MAYRIRELREKKKLTQEQLAQMSGVSRTTIVLLENNEEHEAILKPPISQYIRRSRAADPPPSALLCAMIQLIFYIFNI